MGCYAQLRKGDGMHVSAMDKRHDSDNESSWMTSSGDSHTNGLEIADP